MEKTLKIGVGVGNVEPVEGCIIVEPHKADARYKGIKEAIEKRNNENEDILPEEVPEYEKFMTEWCAKGYPVSVLRPGRSRFKISDVVVLRNFTPMSVIRLDRDDADEFVSEDDDDFVFLVREADVVAKIDG